MELQTHLKDPRYEELAKLGEQLLLKTFAGNKEVAWQFMCYQVARTKYQEPGTAPPVSEHGGDAPAPQPPEQPHYAKQAYPPNEDNMEVVKDTEAIRPRERIIVEILQTVASIRLDKHHLVQWFRNTLFKGKIPFDDLQQEIFYFAYRLPCRLNAPLLHKVVEEGWTIVDILKAPDVEPHMYPHRASVGALIEALIDEVSKEVLLPGDTGTATMALLWWVITGEWQEFYLPLEYGKLALPRDAAVHLILPVGLQPDSVISIYRRVASARVTAVRRLRLLKAGATSLDASPKATVKPSSERVLGEVLNILQARRRGFTWEQIAKQERKPPSWVKRKVEQCLRSLGCSYTADEL